MPRSLLSTVGLVKVAEVPREHSTTHNGTTWQVSDLHKLTKDMPHEDVSLSEFDGYLNKKLPWGKKKDLTFKRLLEHLDRVDNADLNYPILVTPEGRLYDGTHRLIKALRDKQDTIKAIRFATEPPGGVKDAAVHFLTGHSGAGKSTLARALRSNYDMVASTDPIIEDENGVMLRQISKEEKPQWRAGVAARVRELDSQGKNVLIEGSPKGWGKLFGLDVSPDKLLLLNTSPEEALERVRGRIASTPFQHGREEELLAKTMQRHQDFVGGLAAMAERAPVHEVSTLEDILAHLPKTLRT